MRPSQADRIRGGGVDVGRAPAAGLGLVDPGRRVMME